MCDVTWRQNCAPHLGGFELTKCSLAPKRVSFFEFLFQHRNLQVKLHHICDFQEIRQKLKKSIFCEIWFVLDRKWYIFKISDPFEYTQLTFLYNLIITDRLYDVTWRHYWGHNIMKNMKNTILAKIGRLWTGSGTFSKHETLSSTPSGPSSTTWHLQIRCMTSHDVRTVPPVWVVSSLQNAL